MFSGGLLTRAMSDKIKEWTDKGAAVAAEIGRLMDEMLPRQDELGGLQQEVNDGATALREANEGVEDARTQEGRDVADERTAEAKVDGDKQRLRRDKEAAEDEARRRDKYQKEAIDPLFDQIARNDEQERISKHIYVRGVLSDELQMKIEAAYHNLLRSMRILVSFHAICANFGKTIAGLPGAAMASALDITSLLTIPKLRDDGSEHYKAVGIGLRRDLESKQNTLAGMVADTSLDERVRKTEGDLAASTVEHEQTKGAAAQAKVKLADAKAARKEAQDDYADAQERERSLRTVLAEYNAKIEGKKREQGVIQGEREKLIYEGQATT